MHDCAVIGYEFEGEEVNVDGEADCKVACDKSEECGQWSWNTKQKRCTISNGRASPKYSQYSRTVPKKGSASCNCPAPAVPDGQQFPPKSEADSNALFGGSSAQGIGQPMALECWPKDENYTLHTCATTDLRRTSADPTNPFKATCIGERKLERPGKVDADEAWCEQSCKSDVYCADWHFVKPGNGRGQDAGCYHGGAVADACNDQRDYSVVGGRVQHGKVRVISPMANYQVLGLQHAYKNGTFATEQLGKDMCKEICYSDVLCTVWQYYSQGEKQWGCWVEDPRQHALEYPLSLDNHGEFNPDKHAWIDGEFIQHYCPEPAPDATNAPVALAGLPKPVSGAEAAVEGPNMWSWLLPFILLVALVCCAVAALLFCCGEPKKKKAKSSARSRSIAEPKEMEEPLQVVSTPVTVTPTYYAAQVVQQVQPTQVVQHVQPTQLVQQMQPTQMVRQQQVVQMVEPQLVQQASYASVPVQYASAPVQYASAPVQYASAPVQYASAPVQYATEPTVNPGIRF